MTAPQPSEAFFLIVADLRAGLFCIEGPMTDARPWHLAASRARQHPNARHIQCGPAGSDPVALAREFQRTHKLGGVPAGTIMRLSP